MEMKKIIKNIPVWIKKSRFIVLIILLGLFLLLMPSKQSEQQENHEVKENNYVQKQSTEEKLARLLQNVKGAGKVNVMLTVAEGEEIIYQTNSNTSTDTASVKEDTDTVVVSDANRNENGLIRQSNPPKYLGAIIICQGAEDPVVRLSIIDAVSKVTGLKSNCISVLKMK